MSRQTSNMGRQTSNMWRQTPREAWTMCVRLPTWGVRPNVRIGANKKTIGAKRRLFFWSECLLPCCVRLHIWGVRLPYGTPSRAQARPMVRHTPAKPAMSHEVGPKPSGVGHPDAGTSEPFAAGESNWPSGAGGPGRRVIRVWLKNLSSDTPKNNVVFFPIYIQIK